MDRFDIQKLRDLPIEGVAERLGLKVTRHKALCPFHEDKHPSLSFHARRNTYKCFVCDAHGDTIGLAMHVLGKSFKEACSWLASECRVYGVECRENHRTEKSEIINQKSDISMKYAKHFEHPFLNDAARRFLFDDRKLNPKVISWCRLTSWTDRNGTPWLQIPYYDVDGKLVGVQNRRLTPQTTDGIPLTVDSKAPRFMFPKGSECKIYNLPILKRLLPGEPLFITEGCSDCWAMLSAGHKAIAIPSATLLKPKDLEILQSLQTVDGRPMTVVREERPALNLHIYPDADVPGERLYLELVSLANKIGACLTRHDLPARCKDFGEYWRELVMETQKC